MTKDEAFVLKTQDYRDTSLLATFFTRSHGKVRGIVKGIRDTRARFGSTLEPFSLNEILFYKRKRGGDLHLVTQVECLDLMTPIREDLDRLAYASYFTELLDALTEIEDPAPEVFDLMKEALVFLSSGVSPRRAARVFEIKLLELVGLMPDTHDFEKVIDRPLSKGTLLFIEHVRRVPVAELENVKVAQGVGEELERCLRRFVDYHLSKKLNSVIFLEKMGIA